MLLRDDRSDGNNGIISDQSLCDCYRPAKFDQVQGPKLSYENRFVKLNEGEINLVYLMNLVDRVRLNEGYPPFLSYDVNDERCKTGECDNGHWTNAFVGDTNATMWEILPRLNATHAFVSLGWPDPFPFKAQSDFACKMERFMREHLNVKLSLITHPPKYEERKKKSFDSDKLKCDVDVLDRSALSLSVPPSWYWDNMHVLLILNQEYNHRVVESICPIPTLP